ncbi:Legumain 1 [Aphelenchoides besseyi]|nr:Legumain 1 [Aphelenchoides besseyi]
MKFLIVLVSIFGLAIGAEIHAVLVAGSNGWWNYRHQSDVFHAYQLLTTHGVKPENIITFAYDDIAGNYRNPFKGQVFNHPNGPDVYAGVKIDYSEYDVNPENFMGVLTGDVKRVKGGNGRVLKSTSEDKVFVYYADHGAPGLLGFPYDLMTVLDLNITLQSMHDKKMYKELVFYMEACESGSMFSGILPNNLGILAVTASNETELSWAGYCDIPTLPDNCLGDWFSIHWLEDSDAGDLSTETLQTQYTHVKALTNTSNVMHYGDLSISNEVVANFQGHSKSRSVSYPRPENSLESRLRRSNDPIEGSKLSRELQQMKMKRRYFDKHTRELIGKLTTNQNVMTNKPKTIKELECHDLLVKAYSTECFNLGQNSYALNAVSPLTNLCELKIPTDRIVQTIKSHCAEKKFSSGEHCLMWK